MTNITQIKQIIENSEEYQKLFIVINESLFDYVTTSSNKIDPFYLTIAAFMSAHLFFELYKKHESDKITMNFCEFAHDLEAAILMRKSEL